jgi:hypothetical protein
MYDPPSQPSKKTIPADCRADTSGGPPRLHRSTDMATADDSMQLPIGEFEEAFGLTVGVVFQTQRAQYRILEGNSDWRSPTARLIA